MAGTAALAWGFTNGAKALITSALWPNMVGLWTLLQFRTIAERFQHKEQWTTALTLEFTLESLARQATARHHEG
ncbi:hypothetical protein [Arthrobacter bambusae]|uniref:hypothetical protein n=1 Tax=Arthrobacter bambusae TaxID=1338426 RepID=UPI00278910A6|nr:hypothetical protein [Arthrobacter bambusae]MDQ0210355.1 hypothetical protein [Arthrobacter bambusae]MDQ0234804.1 hypothetical protein [Arthrobacter bambusae]